MGLEEALRDYSGQICYLTLNDGTNIEIIPNNQQNSGKIIQQIGNINNQIKTPRKDYNKLVEQNYLKNTENLNNKQKSPIHQELLKEKDLNKTLGKSLKKTVLKSLDGSEKEAKIQELEKLRFFKNKANPCLNEIIRFTEDNEFLQCANCKRFFCLDENEEQNKNTVNNEQNQINNNKKISPQAQQYQQITPQKYPRTQDNQVYPNQPKIFPQQAPQHHNLPNPLPQQGYSQLNVPQNHNSQKNIQTGYPQRPTKPIPYPYQTQTNQNQQYYQQIPVQKQYIQQQRIDVNNQQQYYEQNYTPKGYGTQGSYEIIYQPMIVEYQRQKNYINKGRKNETFKYNSNNNRYNYDSFTQEGNCPICGKKKKSERKLYFESPIQTKINQNLSGTNNMIRNLSFGFKNNQKLEYVDNGPNEYMEMNNIGYYEYQPIKNIIPTGNKNRKIDKHKNIRIKIASNLYQDYYN